MKYTIIYDDDREMQLKRKKHYDKVFKKLKFEKTNKNKEWDDYDIIIYLKQIPLNFGEYTIKEIGSRFKDKIQNDKKKYIGKLPVNAILGYKHMLDLNSQPWYPFTTILKKPGDHENFNNYPYWIIKPAMGSLGRDIKIASKKDIHDTIDTYRKEEFPKGSYPLLVQRYLINPLLVNKRKFDFRIYVLWIDNKVYVNKNFYVRFASKKYDHNDPTDLDAGLTNLSKHKDLTYLARSDQFLKDYKKDYPNDDADFLNGKLQEKIQELVTEYFIYVYKKIPQYLTFWNDKKNHYFNLFGFDLMPDETGKLWLIEVNMMPGFGDNRKNSYIPGILEDMFKIILGKSQKSFIKV